MLDTNICIYIRRDRPASVRRRFATLEQGEASISVITRGELLYGAEKSRERARSHDVLNEIFASLPTLALTSAAAQAYSTLRARLEGMGQSIGPNDLWIAAHALSSGLILVTNNTREFARVPDLKIENWAA